MTDVQTGTRRVRKHVEYIILGLRPVYFGPVSLVVAPVLLPAAFYISVIIFHNIMVLQFTHSG